MIILRIEHKVPDFAGWKKAFENDPINRKKSGLRHYSIFRPLDDPNNVIVDLKFETMKHAQEALSALQNLWGDIDGRIMMNPQTNLLVVVETSDI